MLRSHETLLVYAVPFSALDANGMPAGAVRYDPATGRVNAVHFIGCARHHRLVERRRRNEGRQSVYATSFRYDLAPEAITHTDYHVQRIRHGELIPANAATAKIAGVPFVAPTTAFERARYVAIRNWEQQYGSPPPVDRWPELRLVVPEDGACEPTSRAAVAVPVSVVPAPAPVQVRATDQGRPGGAVAPPTLPPPAPALRASATGDHAKADAVPQAQDPAPRAETPRPAVADAPAPPGASAPVGGSGGRAI
jgi:hypothetical protein